MMSELKYTKFITINGIKRTIKVYKSALIELRDNYDLILCAAFKNDYSPVPGSLIGSLYENNINVEELSKSPEVDGKGLGFWISRPIESDICKRVGVVELVDLSKESNETEQLAIYKFVENIISYDFYRFHYQKIAMPLLGTGYLGMTIEFAVSVLLSTIINCLKTNNELTEVVFSELDDHKIEILTSQIAKLFKENYDVFISYSSKQSDIANKVANALKEKGIRPWIDSNIIQGGEDYLEKIPSGIQNSKVFLLLLTTDAENSPWVKKEIATAVSTRKYIVPYKYGDYMSNEQIGFILVDVEIIKSSKVSFDELINLIHSKIIELA